MKKELTRRSINIIEEKFYQRKSWLIYSEKSIDTFLNKYEIKFDKNNVENTGWEKHWLNFAEDGWLTEKVYYHFEDKPFGDKRKAIRINPALAFGTGSHATTQIAARLAEKFMKGQTVLDIGTGSGILAILASISGAKNVYACDIDATAIMNAKENIELNHINNIHLWAGGVESVSPKMKPGVVIANIISSVLLTLHPHIISLHPKYIIYSGILHKEGSEFLAAIKTHGYEPDEIMHINEWSGVRLKSV